MGSEDPMEVLVAVREFSMHLAMASEEAYGSLPVDAAVTTLVHCLDSPLPDVSLYAIISINHIMDSIPNSAGSLASSGGISSLCSKLLNFDYIDMAEHVITAIERLAHDHSSAILQEGVFGMLVQTMDFFETPVQKKILHTVAVIARAVQSLELVSEQLLPALPVLCNLVQYQGEEALSMNLKALDFFQGLTESLYRMQPEPRSEIEAVGGDGLLLNALQLAQLSTDARLPVLRLLRNLCQCSPPLVQQFFEGGGVHMVEETLASKDAQRPSFVLDVLQLVQALLPKKKSESATDRELQSLFEAQPDLMRAMGAMVLPKILSLYEGNVNQNVRALVLTITGDILSNSEPEFVISYASPASFATFLSEVLSCKDSETLKSVLSLIVVLLNKVPNDVVLNFFREGVVDKIRTLQDINKVKALNFPCVRGQELTRFSPDNIRELLACSGVPSDSPIIEHIIRQIQRKKERRPSGEDEDLEIPQFNRAHSEPVDKPDPITRLSEEIIGLANAAERKVREHPHHAGTQTLIELRELAASFVRDTSEANTEPLRHFLALLAAGISLHELTHSGVLDNLWKWLTSKRSGRRVYEFFRMLQDHTRSGDQYLTLFVQLLVQALRYVHQLELSVSNGSEPNMILGMKSLASRAKIVLQYDATEYEASDSQLPELELKHLLFTERSNMTICIEQFQTLDTVYEGLLKANSLDSLSLFLTSFEAKSNEQRALNQGQLNMTRQHLRFQNLLSQSFDLQTALEELGIRSEGNEQLIRELQAQREAEAIDKVLQEGAGEEDEEDEEEKNEDINKPIQAMQFAKRKESALEPSPVEVVVRCNGVVLNQRMSIFEVANKYASEQPLVLHFGFRPTQEPLPRDSKYLDGENLLTDMILASLSTQETLGPCLSLLKLCHVFNQDLRAHMNALFAFPVSASACHGIPLQAFVSNNLSALLAKQLTDILAMVGGTAPEWVWRLPKECPYLFKFTHRLKLFQATFPNGRALYYYSNRGKHFSVKMLRQKAMVPRDEVLEAGMRVLSDSALLKFGMLEFDFTGEEGTGIGPTLEFYALISKEIRKLDLWRNSGEASGLFPAPVQTQSAPQLANMFTFIGKLVAKALYDGKLIDLPLSPVFWKLVLGQTVSVFDVSHVDPELGRTLLELQEIVNRYTWISSTVTDAARRDKQLRKLTYKGAAISELHLCFTLPGYEIELKPNGKNTIVTLDSLGEYVNLVTVYTLHQSFQAEAFRQGFEKLIGVDSLKFFDLSELEDLICGRIGEDWSVSALTKVLVAKHGYTKDSAVFVQLVNVMSQFSLEEKRHFLQFATGSPRLPIDGFAGLHPPLTVARKRPDREGSSPDEYLPSVMTCQNFLKLPEYSSQVVLEQQLKYAVNNACESFHLS